MKWQLHIFDLHIDKMFRYISLIFFTILIKFQSFICSFGATNSKRKYN